MRVARSGKGARCVLPNARKVPGALCAKLDKALGARCPTLNTTSRNQNALSAQGQRGKLAALLEAPLRNPARRGAQGRRCKQCALLEAGKVLGAFAQREKGARCPLCEARQGARCPLLEARHNLPKS